MAALRAELRSRAERGNRFLEEEAEMSEDEGHSDDADDSDADGDGMLVRCRCCHHHESPPPPPPPPLHLLALQEPLVSSGGCPFTTVDRFN